MGSLTMRYCGRSDRYVRRDGSDEVRASSMTRWRAGPGPPAMRAALSRAEREGLRFFLIGRLVLLTAFAGWILISVPISRALPEIGLAVGFAALGVVPFALGVRFGRFLLWAGLFAVFDVLLITALVLAPQLLWP